MKFTDWTAKAVEERILEMADTLRISPAARGPKAFGNAMPDPVRERSDAYGFTAARFRQSASAGALSRMEECFAWISTIATEGDRKLLYAWSWVKVRKGMKLSAFASENDMNDRMLRREITRICHAISEHLNRTRSIRLNADDCTLSEITAIHASTTVTSEKCATHWIAPDARPQIDPASPSKRSLDHRDIRAR